ncbi:hypothetical protein DRQ36_01045 [bacterium]|nr:MAG: hypothetical protein DRQ36_01045 [bacterium]
MAITIAIWVFVAIAGVVAVFAICFLSQLTRVAKESELTIKALNARLPQIMDHADKVLEDAEATVKRVNATMDELEGPIHYLRMFTHLMTESKSYMATRAGRAVMAFTAGFNALKVIIDRLKQHFTHTGDNALPE